MVVGLHSAWWVPTSCTDLAYNIAASVATIGTGAVSFYVRSNRSVKSSTEAGLNEVCVIKPCEAELELAREHFSRGLCNEFHDAHGKDESSDLKMIPPMFCEVPLMLNG